MIEIKHNMSEKDFQQAIDEGLICQSINEEYNWHRYWIKGEYRNRWTEYHSRRDIETLVEAGYGSIATMMATLQQSNNEKSRKYALLKYEHSKLKQLALDTGLIKRNGKPCTACKSTNTETNGQRHLIDGGSAYTWSRYCFDCEHSEVGGDRF